MAGFVSSHIPKAQYDYHCDKITHVGAPDDQHTALFVSGMYDSRQSCIDLGGYECTIKLTDAPLLPGHNVTSKDTTVFEFALADNTASWSRLSVLLPTIIDLIDRTITKGGRCLLLCIDGKSRSAAVAIAYLMSKGFGYKSASAWVTARRPIVRTKFDSCLRCYDP